ncbi:MAG: type II CAAX endopeptidase family protein [Bryobacteraceae bacterium]
MMKDRLHASDYRFLAVCLALLGGSIWFSARNFYRAFPEASIDFRVNRAEAQTLAAHFLEQRNYGVDGYRLASRFDFDDQAKTFLEREAGLERANRIMGTRVRLWRWSYRWFRPLQKEEYRVDITPAGEFVGFDHQIGEETPRPAIDAARARALAADFLRGALHRDPASMEFVEASEVARPARVDRVYTWKERDPIPGEDRRGYLRDAANRMEVTLHGDEVAGYREYLKIPERWERDYQRLRSKNDMATYVDMAFLAALLVGLAVVIVTRVRGQDVRWRLAAGIGIAGAALSFLAALNEFPLQAFGYPTTDSYASFLSREVLQAALAAFGYGGFLFVLTAGAEPLYRAAFAGQISLGNLFRPRGLRTKRFFLGAILGLSLTGVFVAYQTAFYLIAYRFGAWSPADVPYSDLLNTRFPWLFVLFGGFFPAVSEEFLFRMFAIPFLRKITRWLPAAVVLAAFIWGFGHSGYAQQPFYIRGVEVGIGGVALGLVMLRWGILPTLVWHYSVDAMYSAMLLLRSHSLYFRLSGAAAAGIVALPVLVALAAYWVRGGFVPETGLLNGDEPGPAPELAAEAALDASMAGYAPLSKRRRLAAVAVALACLLALLLPGSRFGESPRFKLTAEQARASADAFLKAQGFNPAAFQHVAYPSTHSGGDDSLALKYFLERRSVAAASALFERYRPVRYWAVRYFKPLEREEALAAAHPESGKVTGFQHTLAEDAPGADLSAEAARQIASACAAGQGWDVGAMDLKESNSEKRKARRDHTVVWEARPGDPRNVEEARYRVEIVVAGDHVAAERAFWKLPEAWTRDRERQNALSILLLTLRIAAISGAVVWALWLLIQNIRKGLVRWRTVLIVAAIPAILSAVGLLLTFRVSMLQNYNTEMPFGTFEAAMCLVMAMSAVFLFCMMSAAAAFLTSFFPDSLAALRAVNRRRMGLDAMAAMAAAAGLFLAIGHFRAFLARLFPAQSLLSAGVSDLIVSPAPALSALARVATTVLTGAAGLALIAIVIRRMPRRWMLAPLALAAVFAVVSSDVHTPGELALECGSACMALAGAILLCRWFARDNYLAYALILFAAALRGPLAELWGTANPAWQMQGWLVAGALALAVAWAVYPAFARGGEPEP